MKNFKVLSLLLVVTVLFGIMCVPAVSASSQGDVKLVYSSDEAWPESFTNTTSILNNNAFWKYKYSNDNGDTYTDCDSSVGNNTYYFVAPKDTGDNKYDYSYVEVSGNKTRVFRDVNTTSNPSEQGSIVGKWWMKPAGAIDRRIAKVFTTPYTGKITVSAKDESGNANIYCKKISDGATKGPVLYIKKKDAAGNTTELWKQTQDYSNSSVSTEVKTINFSDIEIEVNKGDELFFIVSGEQSANGTTKFVYWNPVITYTKTMTDTVIYTDYSSDEAWSKSLTNTTTISNTDAFWIFKYSEDSGSTYMDYSLSVGNNTHNFAAPKLTGEAYDYSYVGSSGTNVTRIWKKNQNQMTDNDHAIGKWWMKTDNTETNHIAKVFTAPYTGEITISAKDESGDAKIHCRALDGAKKGPDLCIMKKDGAADATVLWSKTQDFDGSNGTTQLKSISFIDINVEVEKGDELWFIVDSKNSQNGKTKYVYWNPTIHYDKIGVSKPEFSSTDLASLDSFSAVVSAGTLNINLPVSSILVDDKSAVMCVAVYDGDGKLSNVAISEATTIPGGKSVTIKIENMAVTNITDGYVKVFLVDSMETLVPLDDIGTGKILSSSAE